MRKKWNEKEIDLLKKAYPSLDKESLKKYFLNKSWNAISLKAFKLNLKRDKDVVSSLREKTNLSRYGVTNISKKEKIKDKKVKTLLKSYGVNNPSKSVIIQKKKKETAMVKYGVAYPTQHPEIKLKIKITNLQKYGVNTPSKNGTVKKKIINTNLKIYGVPCVFQVETIKEKIKKTILASYGVTNISKNTEIKNKKIETSLKNYGVKYSFQSSEIIKKSKDTCLKKYGEPYYMSSKEFKEKTKKSLQEKYQVSHPMQLEEFRKKAHDTKKKNESYGKSQLEENLYSLLISIFPKENIERQYRDEIRYPFSCDFYINGIDIFIELQGHWGHGFTPYTGENIPKGWLHKSGKSLYYKSALKTYTEKDPLKRDYALKNNLKYLEIWKKDITLGEEHILNMIYEKIR